MLATMLCDAMLCYAMLCSVKARKNSFKRSPNMDSRSRVPAISVETKRFPGEKQEPRELLTWTPVVEFRRDWFFLRISGDFS